jgi:RsiW-degrading membrane proteinase PrsW (M82 family)
MDEYITIKTLTLVIYLAIVFGLGAIPFEETSRNHKNRAELQRKLSTLMGIMAVVYFVLWLFSGAKNETEIPVMHSLLSLGVGVLIANPILYRLADEDNH